MAKPRCRDCGESTWTRDGRCKACKSFPTIGYQVADWIEAKCAIPDRDQVGEPFLLTQEQLRFTLRHYRINPRAKQDKAASKKLGRPVWRNAWRYERGSQLVRSQKWGKSPFSGAFICNEAAGPALFDGWDADGQPVGRPWPTPVIQVTGLSEDAADNVWLSLLPMIELGDFRADIPDTGKLRIYLPHGGLIEPVTSSALSRLGQLVTFIVQDQVESWLKTNGGRALADNQRRNIAGMGGRWLSTCNAWDPTQESVAQYTAEVEAKQGDVYLDDVEPPEGLSVRNKADRRKALKIVYGDSWWVDLDRVDAEIRALLGRDAAQAERWFLNRKQAAEAKAFSGEKWDSLAKPDYNVPRNALIAIGVDGARFDDALAVIGTEIASGHQFVIGIWERPDEAPDDYEHPMDEVDGAVVDAEKYFDFWRIYIDPGSSMGGNINPLMERWQGRWGEMRVLPFEMYRPRQTGQAVAHFSDAIGSGELSHDDNPTFSRHVKAAIRWPITVKDDEGRELHVIGKDRRGSPHKIDAAAAAVISWEARSEAVKAAATKQPSREVKHTDQRAERGRKPGEGRGRWVADEWKTDESYIDAEDRGRGGSDSARDV